MRSITPFVDWFKDHLDTLPPETVSDVKFAIAQDNARMMFVDLDRIAKANTLPAEWTLKIEEFYYWVF